MLKRAWLALASLVLCACGGGGGSSGAEDNSWLTFTPSPVVVTTSAGLSPAFTVAARSSKTIAEPLNIAIVDRVGVITPSVSIVALSQTEYRATMQVSPNLAVGEYTGNLEVRLCRDHPVSCQNPYPGSPWQVPYRFTVQPGTGGGGGSPSASLTFTPSPIAVTTYAGESPTVTVTARASAPILEPLNLAVVDRMGVITTNVTTTTPSATEYRATLQVSPNLAAGTHTGNLEVRLCRDGATTCQNRYPGSPWQVPFNFTVRSGTNLTTLQPLSGAGAWTTYQGNASHTGHVPASVNPTNFIRRFIWPNAGSSVTIEDGRVFTVSGNTFGSWTLRAISEATGQVLWTTQMGTLHKVNPPAVSNGKVYVTSTGHSDTYFWTFDAVTGAQLGRTAMSSQWETYLAPTVHDGAVYTNSGSYGGLSRFAAATSAFNWFVSLQQYDYWTPAVDDNYVYAYSGNALYVRRPLDGSSVATITDPRFEWAGYSMYGAPVLDGQGSVYATQYGASHGRLIKFNVAQSSVAWDLAQSFRSNPVYANGVLYVVNGNSFEARSPATGELQWSWTAPEGTSGAPNATVVVVGNHAFVRTTSATHAIDLTTHQSVWSYPATGSLAVSANGVLYISTTNSLIAINLQ